MRKQRKGSAVQAEIPMSSMIDIVFLLLIYFIVTQKPIIEETLIQSNLPNGAPSEMRGFPLKIDVYQEDGERYRVMNRLLKPADLFEYLNSISENDPEQPIIINCGSKAKHQKLVHLLDACAAADLTNLNVVNDEGKTL
jgi:biopolymer transport protein ExbD